MILTNHKYLKRLTDSLKSNLDFHDENSQYSSHNFHSFPAKFPPQLPKKFIKNLTNEGDLVLDPMAGSGTTILEGFFNNRKTIGFDIDPLSLMIIKVKTTVYNKNKLIKTYNKLIDDVSLLMTATNDSLENLYNKFDAETKKFIEFWFYKSSIPELVALSHFILKIPNENEQLFFRVIFSSIIITKSGGVSLALDLAHTRPHKAKKIYDANSELVFSQSNTDKSPRHEILIKKIKSPIQEFKKKFIQNLDCVLQTNNIYKPQIEYSDSQQLPLADNAIDLIVTSPPYASNAIDYMRAHKFSLVWFGHSISELKEKRNKYIGGDATSTFHYRNLPIFTNSIIEKVKSKTNKKSLVLHRYYSEMTNVFEEMYRVLKPGKSAIVVVGNSTISGIISETHLCLKEIAENIGFEVPHIGIRNIDRNRRMLPASNKITASQILKRMNEEYILGLFKPEEQ